MQSSFIWPSKFPPCPPRTSGFARTLVLVVLGLALLCSVVNATDDFTGKKGNVDRQGQGASVRWDGGRRRVSVRDLSGRNRDRLPRTAEFREPQNANGLWKPLTEVGRS
ncbi:hypothetical protein BV898_07325 [Hypsibius exemplaris]|uniref:Secreted protein n=1 Tax=Hypsibius exemplaris TaxID=2072580 RepID=A0A1W0WU20_HYPEX|nr:hypothetical protein BV898_07325 [Hypsibius exemplaris]